MDKKGWWDIILSSTDCRSKIPYAGYISCHHWKNRENHPPLECKKENCPIKIEERKENHD